MKILAIDPSTRALGYALFALRARMRASLVRFETIRVSQRLGAYIDRIDIMCERVTGIVKRERPSLCVIEMPQIFGSGKGAAANNSGSVMKLTACVFSLRSSLRSLGVRVELVPVSRWKGTCPKEITQRRMLRKWGAEGDHNAIDAVGLGSWFISSLKI